MAEWLRRWIANPLFFERASSNLADVDIHFLALFSFFLGAKRTDQRCSNRKTKRIECSGFRNVLFLIFVAGRLHLVADDSCLFFLDERDVVVAMGAGRGGKAECTSP